MLYFLFTPFLLHKISLLFLSLDQVQMAELRRYAKDLNNVTDLFNPSPQSLKLLSLKTSFFFQRNTGKFSKMWK